MECSLRAQLGIIKVMNLKPNFSDLARQYGFDRRTVKKYYEGYDGKPKTRNKTSKLDKYKVRIPDYPDGSSGNIRTLNRTIRTPCHLI